MIGQGRDVSVAFSRQIGRWLRLPVQVLRKEDRHMVGTGSALAAIDPWWPHLA